MLKQDLTVYYPYPEGIESTAIYANKVGQTYFEINNYLGNVNAVITDRKSANLTPSASNASTWEAVVMNTSDYYPFGMQMPGRVNSYGTGVEYRYAYNAMEHDNEVVGYGNSYTTEFRQYDPRLARWKSLDPLMAKFPWMSPYTAFDNNPVYFVDPMGLASEVVNDDPPTQNLPEQNVNRKGISNFKASINRFQIRHSLGKYKESQYDEKRAEMNSKRESYSLARKEAKEGKISTSTFAKEYEKYGWAQHDQNNTTFDNSSVVNGPMAGPEGSGERSMPESGVDGPSVKLKLDIAKYEAGKYTLKVADDEALVKGKGSHEIQLDRYQKITGISVKNNLLGKVSIGSDGTLTYGNDYLSFGSKPNALLLKIGIPSGFNSSYSTTLEWNYSDFKKDMDHVIKNLGTSPAMMPFMMPIYYYLLP